MFMLQLDHSARTIAGPPKPPGPPKQAGLPRGNLSLSLGNAALLMVVHLLMLELSPGLFCSQDNNGEAAYLYITSIVNNP